MGMEAIGIVDDALGELRFLFGTNDKRLLDHLRGLLAAVRRNGYDQGRAEAIDVNTVQRVDFLLSERDRLARENRTLRERMNLMEDAYLDSTEPDPERRECEG